MNVIKNYLYNVGYQIFVLLVPLVTTPYITRVLGSHGVGLYAYTNSVIQYFVLFGSIGITLYGNRTIAFERDNPRRLSQTFWEITFLRFITIILAYLAFLLFLLVSGRYTSLYLLQSVQIIAAALDISWLYMGIEDFKRTVTRNLLVKVVSVISIFLLVKDTKDTAIYIAILSCSTLIGNLSLWGNLRKVVKKPEFGNLHLFQHVRPAIAFFVPEITMQVYLILNKTMLGSIVGVESAGFYENSDKIIKMVLAIVTSVSTVMLPRMANVFSKNDKKKMHRYLATSFDFVTFISVPLSLGMAAISPKFAVWFMGPEFAITGRLIFVMSFIIVPIAWTNVIGNQYLLPTQQTKKYTMAISLGAIVNLLLNVFLIETLGVMGAVIATVCSEITVTFAELFFVRKELNISNLFKGIYRYLISGGIMFAVVFSMNVRQSASFFHFLLQAIVGALIYLTVSMLLKAPFYHTIRAYFAH